VVRRHPAFVREALEQWQGVENDTAGDGFYATFDGPARAIRCALDIVTRIRELGIEIRAGVHTGECEIVEAKHAGLAVTIGSRIAAMAGPSEVLASRTVKDLTAGSGFSFQEVGERELNGVPEPWHIYRVIRLTDAPSSVRRRVSQGAFPHACPGNGPLSNYRVAFTPD
jgi:class 3 adenylate cyclase